MPHFGDTPRRIEESLRHSNLRHGRRFIYLIRDPVERTISNYQHSYLSGHYPAGTTLAEAVRKDPILIDASCYMRQIRAYLNVFGSKRLLIIPTHELHADPTSVMRKVEAFLDVRAYDGWKTSLPQSNSGQALGSSLALHAVLPKSLLGLLRNLIPRRLRDRLKNLVASTPSVPKVTDADRQFVFEKVESDLSDLAELLGGSISSWPSVRQLDEM